MPCIRASLLKPAVPNVPFMDSGFCIVLTPQVLTTGGLLVADPDCGILTV